MTEDSSKGKQLFITESVQKYWREISRWARFLAILLFCAAGFTGALTLLFLLDPSMLSAALTGLFISLLLLTPGMLLLRFRKRIKIALENSEIGALENAFSYLKWFYIYSGIITAIYLSAALTLSLAG